MMAQPPKVRVNGKTMQAPSMRVNGEAIIVNGRWLRIASIQDEEVIESNVLRDPETFLATLRSDKPTADVFTFSERLPNVTPRLKYPFEWDNLAVIPINSFTDWWENRLPQETRKNVRRAGRRGVVVQSVQLDDTLVRGIKNIYDETPVRQGKRFWHYNKDLATVKRENGTYREQSEFLCAYYKKELIGFIRLVYVGQAATIMQIVSKNSHYDKRPANALIARAVESCAEKGIQYLIYGKFIYGKNARSSLSEFKRRNGFEQVMAPTYYIPLTWRGKIAVKLKLHLGIQQMLPATVIYLLMNLRSWFNSRTLARRMRAQIAE